MTTFTKEALVRSFLKLLNDRPFDKITVTDVVRECGVNRNTFYYHYQDIYALVDEVFRSDAERILKAHTDDSSWHGAVLEATRFVRENQVAVYHLYDSINRDKLEAYLFNLAKGLCGRFIEHEAEGLDVSAKTKDDLTTIYAVTIEGLVIEWLHNGMREDPETFIRDNTRLLEGTARFALERAAKCRDR